MTNLIFPGVTFCVFPPFNPKRLAELGITYNFSHHCYKDYDGINWKLRWEKEETGCSVRSKLMLMEATSIHHDKEGCQEKLQWGWTQGLELMNDKEGMVVTYNQQVWLAGCVWGTAGGTAWSLATNHSPGLGGSCLETHRSIHLILGQIDGWHVTW